MRRLLAEGFELISTMSNPIPITTLEVIGYANRLADSMLPAVVPPVFRLKGDQERILLPPFVIRDGYVFGGTESNGAALQMFNEAGEVTLFAKPQEARPDFELWINLDKAVHYEAISDASAQLQNIAREHIIKAEEALLNADFNGAEECCRIALSADDRVIDSLAISAAIAQRNKRNGDAKLMEKMALGHVTAKGFDFMVRGYSKILPDRNVVVTGDLCGEHPMKNMATQRA